MFELLRARRLRAIAENRQAVAVLRFQERLLSPNAAQRENLKDTDEDDWQILGGSIKELDVTDAAELRNNALEFSYRNSHAKNILRLIVKYVVGRGFDVQPASKNPMVQKWIETFWRVNRMEIRKKEIVNRAMRDGECFIRFFMDSTGMLLTRFMDPGKVKEPDEKQKTAGNASFGIETDKDDVEEVLAYWYKGERVLADEVHHIKILVDSDVKRGRSYIEAMMPYLKMYNDWLRDRFKLNKVRSTIAFVKQITGTSDQAASIVNAQKTINRKAPDGTSYSKTPEGVSVFTGKGVDYKMLSPNLQASDVQHDGRNILLAISAGAGLSESMVTSDASNANYASSMIAEAPAVREFMDWQDFFGVHFSEILEKVIAAGIKAGEIPAKEQVEVTLTVEDPLTGEQREVSVYAEQETSTDVEITFPEIIHRDIDKETKAYVLQSNQGWISNRTAAARLDLDYDYELEQMKEEQKEEMMGQGGENPEEQADEDYLKARSKAQQTPEGEEEPETEKAEK